MPAQTKIGLLIFILFFLFGELFAEVNGSKNVNVPNVSEQAYLLKLLKELPSEIGIKDSGHLLSIEEYIIKTEEKYDSEIVLDFAVILHETLDRSGSYEKGIAILEGLFSDFSEHLSKQQEHRLTIMIAEFYNATGDYVKVINQLEAILPDVKDSYLIAGALSTLGIANNNLGRYGVAIKQYLEAIPYYKELNRSDRLAEVFNRLGMVYYYLEEHETAISYYQQNLEIAEELGDVHMLGNIYINIGAAYKTSGKIDEALLFYEKGIEMAEQTGNIVDMARVNMNIANLYAELEHFDEALRYYNESLTLSEESGIQYGILINQYNIGNLLFDTGQFEESEKAYLAAYDLMNRENHPHQMLRITERMSQLYEVTGEYEQAYLFLKTFKEINSDIFDAEKLQIAGDLRAEYETELKEQELVLADTIINEKNAENRFLILLVLSLAVASIFKITYYHKRNQYLIELYSRNLEVIRSLGIDRDSIRNHDKKTSEDEVESDRLHELYMQIKPLLTEEKVYRDPDISLSKLAEMVGSNRKYVSEAILITTDLNFNNFINFYRINEAKTMILKGEDSISEVQYACGFNSRSTFYTAFKKFTGMSPSEFRKMARQKQEL